MRCWPTLRKRRCPASPVPHFDLEASAAHITQPDGATVYSWGYGCSGQPTGSAPAALQLPATGCPTMQIPGPTLIVNQGETITITLTNNLPAAAGRTSILFPGFNVAYGDGVRRDPLARKPRLAVRSRTPS